ncbi:hypothetical protein KI387_014254 [Taxus chinensis]|uniref:Aluminum-activated malate transporter n=1 Tax=Taxus chinensis TaxID=29808 RepID=A0AA38CMY1_TAXCH|nr:hypothetical protein KI387_014254 [Taxus chinensis]
MASADLNGECRVNVTICDNPRNRKLLRKVGMNPTNVKSCTVALFGKIWRFGKEDPRRVVHSIKYGVALTLVSLLYLMNPFFTGIGDHTIWAILTVVVVFDFTVGGTLSKGLNRGLGTLVAGSVAMLVSYLSEHVGEPGEAIIIGFSVFVIGAAGSFIRFFPTIKKRYDYGVVISILTFNLITVSGYRVDNIFRMANERLSTIAIGCGVCLVISLFVYPIWAGEDLHNSTADKFEGLAQSLEGCIHEYFNEPTYGIDEDEIDTTSEDAIYEGYKSVLNSKATDESLATFASWEPMHGQFRYRHPWKQYVKIGAKLRHLAYSIVALHGCLRSEIQSQRCVRSVLKKPCMKVGEEAAKLLRDLSWSIKHMRRCDSETTMKHLQVALKDLQAGLDALPKLFMDSHAWHIQKIKENGKIDEEEEEPFKMNGAMRKVELRCSSAKVEGSQPAILFRRVVSLQEQYNGKGRIQTETQTKTEAHFCVNFSDSKARGHSVEYAEELQLATFAWLVVEIVVRIQHAVEAVDELAMAARFKPGFPRQGRPSKPLMKVSPRETLRSTRILEIHATPQCGE